MSSFLKKLGQVIVKIGTVAAAVGGIALPFFGSGKASQVAGIVVNDLTSIGQVVAQMEVALQGKAGTEKLAAAIALVGPIVKTSELVSWKKVQDDALLQKGIEEITQGVVDVLNSIHPDEVKS